MIDYHQVGMELEERRRALREQATASRMAAAARRRRAAGLRTTAGVAVARLGLWLAGPAAARRLLEQA